MEARKSTSWDEEEDPGSDLLEQMKSATKESHVRAENIELMQSFQKGLITLPQYKLLLCSLYEIYKTLEEQLDINASHPGVAPIYFPQELDRLEFLERDLEHLFGSEWRQKIVVPTATQRYVQRLREIGKDNPTLLIPHAYSRYLCNLSGGQVLGRNTQKSLGLTGNEGVSFFSFPGVPSPQRFKQMYRTRVNSVELTEEERQDVLEETVQAFQFNAEVFDGVEKLVRSNSMEMEESDVSSPTTPLSPSSPVAQVTMGLVALATVGMGFYAM